MLKKRIVSLMMVICMVASVLPAFEIHAGAAGLSGSCGDDLTWAYDADSKTLSISGSGEMNAYKYDLESDMENPPWKHYASSIENIILPPGLVNIGSYAFASCSNITHISIPNTVQVIGSCAFARCTQLQTIDLPNSVTTIHPNAFDSCLNLKQMNIPDSVTEIGRVAFGRCTSLQRVTLSANLQSVSDSLFVDCDKLVECNIPQSVTSIGDDAFKGCASLSKITIPQSVTSIGGGAFSGCASLSEITMPQSVTSIGDGTFSGCASLSKITIPQSVTSIGGDAFSGCASLSEITIPDGVLHLDRNVFADCKKLKKVSIPNTIELIPDGSFRGCDGLETINIPDSVCSIGDFAFENCKSLSEFHIGKNIQYIRGSAFVGCDSLVDISVETVQANDNAYINQNGAIIYDRVTGGSFVDGVFVPSIKKELHIYPAGKTDMSYTVPEDIEEIGYYAFCKNKYLQHLILQDGVTKIGEYAFANCESLMTIVIPKTVNFFNVGAFSNCFQLTDIYYGGSQAQWSQIENVYGIPEGVVIHYNSNGPEKPSGMPGIVGTYPENGAKNINPLNFENLTIRFNRDIAPSVNKHEYVGVDFNSTPLSIYRASDDALIYQATQLGDFNDCCSDIHPRSTDKTYIDIFPTQNGLVASALLEKNTEYYVTMGKGFIKFSDGSSSEEIPKGAWTFRTTGSYEGIIPLITDPIVRIEGNCMLPVLLKDANGKCLKDHKVSYTVLGNNGHSETGTTDENGVILMGPLVTSTGKHDISVRTNIPDYGSVKETLTYEIKNKGFAFDEVFELNTKFNFDILDLISKNSNDVESKIEMKLKKDSGKTTLELSTKETSKPNHNPSLMGKNDFPIPFTLNSSDKYSDVSSKILEIENFDPNNSKHIDLVGYYFLSLMAENNKTAYIYKKLLNDYKTKCFAKGAKEYTELEKSQSTEVSMDDISLKAGGYTLSAYKGSTTYERSAKYNSKNLTKTYSSAISNKSGDSILKGDWILGIAGSTIFAENLNKSTQKISIERGPETTKLTIASSEKGYDGIAGTEKGKKVQESITYSNEDALNIIDKNTHLSKLSKGSEVYCPSDVMKSVWQDIIAANTNGEYSKTVKYNTGFSYDTGKKVGDVSLGLTFNGDKSFEFDGAVGAVHNGKTYLATNCESLVTEHELSSQGYALSDVLKLVVESIVQFAANSVNDSFGRIRDGVLGGGILSGMGARSARVYGTPKKDWYVSITTMGSNQAEPVSQSLVNTSATEADKIALSALDSSGNAIQISPINDPYVIQVYTDSDKNTKVENTDLQNDPCHIEFTTDVSNLSGLNIYKWNAEKQIYISTKSVTQDKKTNTVCGLVDENTEYVLASKIEPNPIAPPVVDNDSSDSNSSNNSSGSGGGGASSNVSVSSSSNGKVFVSPSNASKGSKVTLTVKPNTGYKLDSLVVKDSDGNKIELTKESDAKYTFTMPAGKVKITPKFVKVDEQPQRPSTSTDFVDVSSSAYYADAVAWAVEKNITTGTSATMFSPSATCTRAQAVTFLWRAAGSPAPTSSNNPFTDLDSSAYYYDAVLWAVEKGITTGTSATIFTPASIVTRGQVVTFLHRANGSPVSSDTPFSDVKSDAFYAGAVAWAASEGITSGTTATTFSPDDGCTRSQIVTFLYRANQ